MPAPASALHAVYGLRMRPSALIALCSRPCLQERRAVPAFTRARARTQDASFAVHFMHSEYERVCCNIPHARPQFNL